MKKNSMWYGFLEAGAKSSAVLRDDQLETRNDRTVFLFNLARNKITEYRRDIVESKLRELSKEETNLIDTLKKAYKVARKDFEAPAKTPIFKQQTADTPIAKPENTIKPEIDDEIDIDVDIEDGDFNEQTLVV